MKILASILLQANAFTRLRTITLGRGGICLSQQQQQQHRHQVNFVQLRYKKPKLSKQLQQMMDFDEELRSFNPEVAHGEPVVDRKSVFQGHCAAIYRLEHVELFLAKLKDNKKIENAFHNMWAYRIDKSNKDARLASKSSSILQDCDDDGEQAAGGRLLTLLQILNVVNVMVVVTRWYGGIQLGPARFKHINNAARDSLVKANFVQDQAAGEPTASKSKSGGKKGKK